MTTTQVRRTDQYLSILHETGALAVMEQDLTLWQNKPLLTNPRIRAMRFSSASAFINEVIKVKDVSWDELIAEIAKSNWQIADNLKRRVSGSPTVQAISQAISPVPVSKTFLSFFRSGTCVVHSSVDDSTVLAELEKSLEHKLMKALRADTYPHAPGTPVVAALLTDYPELSWLVALALIQLGHCSAYSQVQTRTSTLIQTKISEDDIISNAIYPIVFAYPLPRLANFTCSSKNDDAVWRDLFSGCKISELEDILVDFGKTRAELNTWSSYPPADRNRALVNAAANCSRREQYKIHILRFLRAGKPAPYMLPWLDDDELRAWLNPKPVTDERMVLDAVPEPSVPSERSLVEAVFAKAKVNKPAFVDLFISEGYRLDHLEDVLTHFDNPDTQPLRALLTGPNKLDVLKALRAPQ